MEQLVRVLEMTLSPDQTQLNESSRFMSDISERNYSWLLQALLSILSDQTILASIRQQAGLQLKNMLNRHSFWSLLDKPSRSSVQRSLLATLGCEQWRPSTAALCIQALAIKDIPTNDWPDLFQVLVENIIGQSKSDAVICASIETVGYICSSVQHSNMEENINQILTAIMFCINLDREPSIIKLTAMKALSDSLEFATVNFARQTERNYIMQVVCEATQSKDTDVSSLALECLIKIVSLFYPLMDEYMACALCPITLQAINSGKQKIVFQGVEFWSTICDIELEMRENCDCDSQHYSLSVLPQLVDSLHRVIASVTETDQDDWTPSKAASECLRVLCNCCGNDVIQRSLVFITHNIKSEDWTLKYASIMSIASNIEGPDKSLILPLVRSFFQIATDLLEDDNAAVRQATCYTMSYITDTLPEIVIEPDILPLLMQVTTFCLGREAVMIEHACTSIARIVPGIYQASTCLSQPSVSYYTMVLERLVYLTDLNNPILGAVASVRQVVFQALMELTTHCPWECYHLLEKTILVVLERLQRLSQSSGENSSGVNITKSFLCSTLNSMLLKIEPDHIAQVSDRVVLVLLQLLQVTDVQEDALMAFSSLISLLGQNFGKYVPSLFPFLSLVVVNCQDFQVTKTENFHFQTCSFRSVNVQSVFLGISIELWVMKYWNIVTLTQPFLPSLLA